jgi:iron complex outermembrane receptor protein
MRDRGFNRIGWAGGSAAIALISAFAAPPALAQEQARAFDISAQPMGPALQSFARQSDREILFTSTVVGGKRSAAVRGRYEPAAALAALLRGSGLAYRATSAGAYLIEPRGDEAVAQGDEAESSEVEEIVVTAQKREQRLIDVPMSITALSEKTIERAGIQSLLDLGRAVPGLIVTESGPGQNRIFMRGVANGNSSVSLVGVYVDEMPVTGMSLGQPDLQLVDVERVEVLRGPQGTLYGQGSAGGTLRFITRNPSLSGFSGKVTAEGYSTAHGDPSVKVTGVADVTLVPDKVGLRISGTYADIGGWVDQPDAGREDINDQNLRNVRVKALVKATDDLSITGTVVVHRNQGGGIPTGADEHQNVYFPTGDPLARESVKDDYEFYNAAITYDFGGGVSLLSSTSYVHADKSTAGIALKLPGYETFNRDWFEQKTFTQELRLSASNDKGLSWVVGGYYTDDDVDRVLDIDIYVGGPAIFLSLPSRELSKSVSVFGDVSYALTDRLTLGAGARVFRDRRESEGVGKDTFESVDPRFYGSFDLTPDSKLYFNVAKGFRSGGLDVVNYGPESVWSYEVGTKGSAFDHRFRWEVAGFFSTYKDIQIFTIGSGVVGTLSNAGDAEIKGVDWSLGWQATDHLWLEVNGNLTKAEITKTAPGAITTIPGDRVDLVPEYSFALAAEYRFDWRTGAPGFARIDLNRIGPSILTDRSLGILGVESDEVTFLNARLGAEFGRYSIELFGRNLLDENGLQDPMDAIGFGSRPQPRTLGVKVAAEF